MAYHYFNVHLGAPFKTRKYQHKLAVYDSIVQHLNNRCLTTDLNILDNEASQNYKDTIKYKLGVDFQLVPPYIYIRNAAE